MVNPNRREADTDPLVPRILQMLTATNEKARVHHPSSSWPSRDAAAAPSHPTHISNQSRLCKVGFYVTLAPATRSKSVPIRFHSARLGAAVDVELAAFHRSGS